MPVRTPGSIHSGGLPKNFRARRSSVSCNGGTTEEITTASASNGSRPWREKSGSRSAPYSSAVRW